MEVAGGKSQTQVVDLGKDYWPTDPVRGGYFRRSSFKYIGLMNPNHRPVHDWVAMSYLYGRLLYADGTHKPNVKWMAESWEFTGPTSAILKLRKGIKFHDGSDFNAAAYKYQLEWMMEKKTGPGPGQVLSRSRRSKSSKNIR